MEKKEKSLGINAILNVCRTLLSIIFPLITYPYVSRVIQVKNLGKVNYSLSIVSYFALISALGFYTYAVRECSRRIKNKEKLQEFVSEVFSLNILSMCIAYVLLFFTLVVVKSLHSYCLLVLISSLSIIFTTIGVEWINIAYEDYFYITIRSFIVQFFSLVTLFIFVQSVNDYYVYAIITVAGNGLISILNIFHVSKYCKIYLTRKLNVKKHLKPILVLFSNNVAVSIYLNSDITILGWMTGDIYVGLYSVAVKVYGIIKQLIASFYSVILARMSLYYQEKRYEDFKELLNKTLNIIILLSIPASFGLYLISEDVIIFMFGKEYIQATVALKILSVAFLFAIFGGALAYCVNIPLGREKNNLIATTLSAIVNILLNIIFIPYWKHAGAAFTTFLAELVVSFILLVGLREYIDFFNKKQLIYTLIKSIIASCPMIALNLVLKRYLLLNAGAYLIAMIIISSVVYLILSLLMKNVGLLYFYDNNIKRFL